MVKEIGDNNFNDEIANSSVPVVVDFWASWCGPCKMLSPVIDELSEEFGEKVKFTKVNVDDNPGVSSKFSVSSIPTVLIFKDGNVAGSFVGFKPKQLVKADIEKYI